MFTEMKNCVEIKAAHMNLFMYYNVIKHDCDNLPK